MLIVKVKPDEIVCLNGVRFKVPKRTILAFMDHVESLTVGARTIKPNPEVSA